MLAYIYPVIAMEEIKKQFGCETALVVLICRVFFHKAREEDLKWFTTSNQIDWNHFYEVVSCHELRPIVCKILNSKEIENISPILARLKQDVLSISYFNLQILRETHRLQELFEKEGLHLISYKGVHLSNFLFGDYSMREVCDADFIIDYNQTIKATRLLIHNGYQTDFYFNEADEEYVKKLTCERPFYNNSELSSGISVELHWKLLQSMFDVNVSNAELIANTTKEKKLGLAVSTLNTEYQLISILCHHGINDVWRSLKHLVDISAFVEKQHSNLDWPGIQAVIAKQKIKKSSIVGFKAAEALFGIKSPLTGEYGPETARVVNRVLQYPLMSRLKYSRQNLLHHLMLRDNTVDKFKLIANYFAILLRPSPDDMKFVGLPRPLFFLYYVIKPYRIITSRLTSVK